MAKGTRSSSLCAPISLDNIQMWVQWYQLSFYQICFTCYCKFQEVRKINVHSYHTYRIKTEHPFLVEVSARRRGYRLGKMTCQRPSLRAETSTKIWMSGLNPNYNTTPLHSARNSRIYRRNSERISLSSDWRRHFVFAVPTSGTTPSDRIAWFPANNSID